MRRYREFPQGIRLYTDVSDLIPTMAWMAETLIREKWEPETLAVLNQHVDAETVMVDIGAWIGVLTVFCASRAKRVVAYEPDPQAFSVLEANVELNGGTNVICSASAVGDRDGSEILGGNPADNQFGCSTSRVLTSAAAAARGLEVPSLCLDTVVDQLRLAEGEKLFIKMDIEGGEELAIPASRSVWKRNPKPTLLISLHGRLSDRPEMTNQVVTHLVDEYGADRTRIVSWDAEAKRVRLSPLRGPIADDSMQALLFVPIAFPA